MITHPAALLGIPLLILDSTSHTPAKQTLLPPKPHTAHPDGPFTSESHIRQLAKDCDILTVEIEHVNADVLEAVEKEGLCEVQPSPRTIRLIQDKYLQKKHLEDRGLAVAPFEAVPSNPSQEDMEKLAAKIGVPMMLKSRTLAYDGRGNSPLKSTDASDIAASLKHLGADRPLYAEKWANFKKEVAVMVVRNKEGEVRSYDAVETIHRESILRVCQAPLRVAGTGMIGLNERARKLAEKAVATLEGAGIFGVEMFLMDDGEWPIGTRCWMLISIRRALDQRDCSSSSQLWPPHYRSVPHFSIREPSSCYPVTSPGFNRAGCTISSHAEPAGSILIHGRDRQGGRRRARYSRSYCPFVWQS